MAILNKEQLSQLLKDRFGESTDDADISFMEDITDTFDNLSDNQSQEEIQLWKDRYEDMKTKYRDRFFKGMTEDTEPEEDEVHKPLRFEDLFKTEA